MLIQVLRSGPAASNRRTRWQAEASNDERARNRRCRRLRRFSRRSLRQFSTTIRFQSSSSLGLHSVTFIFLSKFLFGNEPTNHCELIHDTCEHYYDCNRYKVSGAHNGAFLSAWREGPSH